MEAREIALHTLNRDSRGTWSDGVTMLVLDRRGALFLYEQESGELVAELGLDRLNRGPRGIWSDGEVMYVADANDTRVYSYNVLDAIDAHLAALTLSGIDLGEFSPADLSYGFEVGREIDRTTVAAAAAHNGASVVIEPADADGKPENGRQVAVENDTQIVITVISEDGSRTRTYTIALERANAAPVASEIPVVEPTAGDEPAVLNLDNYFSDPDSDQLCYTVGDSSYDEISTVEATGAMLRTMAQGSGGASFEVFASDGEFESEPRTIEIRVEPASSVAPPIEVRLAARPLTGGSVESGLQERNDGGN